MIAEKTKGTLEVRIAGQTFTFTFEKVEKTHWEYFIRKRNNEIKKLFRNYGPNIMAVEIDELYKSKGFQSPTFEIKYNHTQQNETQVPEEIPGSI